MSRDVKNQANENPPALKFLKSDVIGPILPRGLTSTHRLLIIYIYPPERHILKLKREILTMERENLPETARQSQSSDLKVLTNLVLTSMKWLGWRGL